MMSKNFALVLGVLSVCSCAANVQERKEVLSDYSLSILDNKSGIEYQSIQETNSFNSQGAIYLVGELNPTISLKESFSKADLRDNTSASEVSDGLKDFAGEQIIALYDVHNTPYYSLYELSNLDSLRRNVINLCLSCIEEKCAISPYDKEGTGKKAKAKYIVLDSPYLASFGGNEAQEIFDRIGSKVRIVSPFQCMIRELTAQNKDSYRVAVYANSLVKDPEVYQKQISDLSTTVLPLPVDCYVYLNEGSNNPLKSLLDSYLANSYGTKLDAILIDDNSIDPHQIRKTLEEVRSIMNEDYTIYGHMFSEDFKLLIASESVCNDCFDFLSRNIIIY